MSTENEVIPSTRIITLLEANDARDPSVQPIPGQWTNNLAENTVIREGDAITVKQSMIDTTSESEGIIEVGADEEDITIKFGMYLQDSGNGTLDGGNAQSTAAGNFLTYSGDVLDTPSGKNYILQNFSDLPFTECWYVAGLQPVTSSQERNPGVSPGNDFSIQFKPTAAPGDWWEYTIEITGGATYVPPPGGPFPNPPNDSTSPILLKTNLQGLKARYHSFENARGVLISEFRVYADGWNPASGTPDFQNDHIGSLQVIYDRETGRKPLGYASTPNPTFNPLPAVPEANQWVFRTGTYVDGGGTIDSEVQLWLNYDPAGGSDPSTVYRVCNSFRLMVDSFNDVTKGDPTNAPYQQTLSFTGQNGPETLPFSFNDWGNAKQSVYGNSALGEKGVFEQYQLTDAQAKAQFGLEPTNETADQFANFAGTVFWVQFQALPDSKNPDVKIFEPFIFDAHVGISVLPYGNAGTVKQRRTDWSGKGFGFGCYGIGAPGAKTQLIGAQITDEPVPQPVGDGVQLLPRIFTQKISIPRGKYTYSALAQELTDRLNSIPTQVIALNNNPFPDTDNPTTPADNPVAYSSSRILTSSQELAYQQSVNVNDLLRLPTFPSEQAFVDGASTPKQPVWVSEDGTECCQFDEAVVGTQPRWCGAEALSFIYDESSDTFQVAQAHTNMYSRLDGGVIARQFSVKNNTERVTCDKMGGIFLNSLEPTSLFFDKMNLIESEILITNLTRGPQLVDLKTGSIDVAKPQNTNLDNSLTHVCRLIEGRNITGNFLGVASHIDKRTRIIQNLPVEPLPSLPGGAYGQVDTTYNLDIGVDTPITIKGTDLTNIELTDPYFQIEISGANRQDILGAETKNNLIQSIVGKYFTNGGYTTGNPDDGFRYVHKGDPMVLKSLSVRILDSNGNLATGLGETSAVILEVDTDK